MELVKAKSVSYGGKRDLSVVKYIVIHYTGNKGDTATANVNYFAHTNTRSAGAHIFIDRTGLSIMSIPLNLVAWSVGGYFTQSNGAGSYYKKCTNTNSVSIELCDIATQYPSDKQIKATRSAIAWIQSQCPNAKTIIRHWDVNGKSCPARMAGKNNAEWARFKSDLAGSSASSSTSSSTNSSTSSSSSSKPSSQITVDGQWGKGTTRAAQKVFGTPVDGIVSRQMTKYRSYMPNCSAASWQFLSSGYKGGSALIKEIQRWCGASVDGLCGPGTIKALQKRLGVSADGYMGPATVRAFQKYLNKYL